MAFNRDTTEDTLNANEAENLFENAANITTGMGNTAPHTRGVNSAKEIRGNALETGFGSLPRATITFDGQALRPNEIVLGTAEVRDNTFPVAPNCTATLRAHHAVYRCCKPGSDA